MGFFSIMIWFFTPYSSEKSMGPVYNKYCETVPDEDWICLMDGDSMFLESNFGHIAQNYIDRYPECRLFIPVTNRVGKKSHCFNRIRSDDPNIIHHRKISEAVRDSLEIKDMSHVRYPSMPCFLFSKKTWKEVGGFYDNGQILGVDIRFSKKTLELGPCYRMNGLYLFHYYRLCEGINSRSHIL